MAEEEGKSRHAGLCAEVSALKDSNKISASAAGLPSLSLPLWPMLKRPSSRPKT